MPQIISTELRAAIIDAYDGTCQYCDAGVRAMSSIVSCGRPAVRISRRTDAGAAAVEFSDDLEAGP
jgi:predicted DCC family thiol-disulfide oxidoreductase YuxK